MAHNEPDTRQAEHLDKVVGNIICGDRDLFQEVEAGSVSRETMELIDLATFIMPLPDTSDKGFEQRMSAFVVRESHREVLQTAGGTVRGSSSMCSWFVTSIRTVVSAGAAFFTSLFMEPMPGSRGTRSIDTPDRRWYNSQMGGCPVSSVPAGSGHIVCFGFSDGDFGYKVAVCR